MSMNESRRAFLRTAGKALGSAALVAAAAPVVSACKEAVAESTPAVHPFTYVELNPEEVEKRGYDSFFALGGCCIGAADALIGTLADKVGYPFNQLPISMFANGAAGYGAGTLCGSLGGAVAAIGLVCDAAAATEITAELLGWYRTTEFPIYKPEMESDVTTVSGSVNCADSVGAYIAATGVAMGDTQRKQRCAGVTADVARKTAELLNAHFAAK